MLESVNSKVDVVMKKRTPKLAVLLLLLCLGLAVTTKIGINCFQVFPSVSSKISGLKQSNFVASADVYIQHTYRGDLVVDLGVGNPDQPDWSVNIWNEGGGEEGNLDLAIDISEATRHLPPSESNRWFLRVYDAKSGNLGQIAEFTITYEGETYASACVPVRIFDLQACFSYIPGVPLELALSRRMSIRDFPDTEDYTVPEVSWELLSRVLWAGYGYSSWGRTVPNICGNYPLTIYVCNKTAAYRYDPETQSLETWKVGDYRFHGIQWQHRAPVELFIAWDMNKCSDIRLGWEEAGCIVQNIYLQANALGLGTVCTSGYDEEAVHEALGLPTNEIVLYNMPLGHPEPSSFYNFTIVDPPGSSELPQVRQSSVFLEYALMETRSSPVWSEIPLTRQEISQILWSAYGRSYLKDMRPSFWSFQYQHRTVPSAHGQYPLTIWMADSTGVYVYNDYSHRILLEIEGDKRAEIAEAAGASWIASAPTMLMVAWNTSKMEDPERQDYAYTEVGCVVQNVHLESVAWGLVADWTNIADEDAMKVVLGLVEHTDIRPLTVVTVGHPSTYQYKVRWNGTTYMISISTNSTVTNLSDDKEINFDVTGPSGTIGFCNVTLPKEMPYEAFTVSIDGTPVDYTLNENATHNSLYFTYNNMDGRTVNVIPEFASSLLLFIIFLLVTVVTILVKNTYLKKAHARAFFNYLFKRNIEKSGRFLLMRTQRATNRVKLTVKPNVEHSETATTYARALRL